jgi:two-component system CheB/CheR fusion protein
MKKTSNSQSSLAKKTVTSPASSIKNEEPSGRFDTHIIGIGASAGGLEAIEQFFSTVPADSDMAFVVVQHLDPHHKGMMCEILQRATPIPVQQITDCMKVQPNNVYVIPPGYDLSIVHGVLHLLEPTEPHGLRLPINFFLCTLAVDQKEHSIGVILSGMGSDGVLGLRAIKEQAGAAFVQSPSSAQFDGMPSSAIHAGLADVVAPAEELITKIISFIRHTPNLKVHADTQAVETDVSSLEKIVLLLRAKTGHDFSLYKKTTISRRIERRMALHQLPNITGYIRYLRTNSQEIQLLFKELLIGVTSFFRDPKVWEQLKSEFIPALVSKYPKGTTLRAWVTACSSGEEAYTLAIIFREALEEAKTVNHYSLQIFATDLDIDAIDKARTGFYPSSISADLSEARLQRYFVQEDDYYRVSKELREMVIFAPQNLVMDPPFTKLDILTCRNMMIYIEADLQKKLLPLFHYSLKPGGVMVLGSAETVGSAADLFTACTGTNRIYQRSAKLTPADLPEFPSAYIDRHVHNDNSEKLSALIENTPNLQKLTDSLLLQQFAPAAVLVTEKGDIVYINGKTGQYLEPAAGKVNHNLFAMLRQGLTGPLNEGFTRALRQAKTLELKNLKVGTNGGTRLVTVIVKPLSQPTVLKGMVLVAFINEINPSKANKTVSTSKTSSVQAEHVEMLEQELRNSNEQLQITREEMQTSQEELKSINEELQSTNEELQSTNEELTTSKEEMQSMNEELQTVNHELGANVDELSKTSDDMNNLLNSTDIATLFLDNNLRVRRFTSQTASIFKLLSSDAGRPITDLASILDYPALAEDAQEVINSLIIHEEQTSANDGRWFKVRIMPYRTQDNRIDGIVIVFSDITEAKLASDELFNSRQILLKILDNIPQRVFWKNSDSVYQGSNKRFAEDLGYQGPDDMKGMTDHQIASPTQSERTIAEDRIILQTGKAKLNIEEEQVKSDGKHRWLNLNKIPLTDKTGKVVGLLGTYEDITDRKGEEKKSLADALAVLQAKYAAQTEDLQRVQRQLQDKKT